MKSVEFAVNRHVKRLLCMKNVAKLKGLAKLYYHQLQFVAKIAIYMR